MDGYSVWDEASRDYDSEARLVAQANLRVASTGVMQYLALAQTNDEFEGRLMLATASIQELSDSTGVPLDEVTASLRNRWEMLVEAGNVKLATNDPASAFRKIDFGMGKCGECGRVFDLFDPQQAEEWYSGHDCEPDSPNRQHEGSRKTASDGQCQNAGCEENAGIGGSYCNRCSMLTNASRKTAGDNDTCSCPCGCDAEDPDVCSACEFFGEHANKNNLPEYKDTSPIAEYNKRQKGNTTSSRRTAGDNESSAKCNKCGFSGKKENWSETLSGRWPRDYRKTNQKRSRRVRAQGLIAGRCPSESSSGERLRSANRRHRGSVPECSLSSSCPEQLRDGRPASLRWEWRARRRRA